MRALYTVIKAWQHRHALQKVNRTTYYQATCLNSINCLALFQDGIRVMILDFDGVLASHGEIQPVPDLMPWINQCLAVFGKGRVLILSNNPLPLRVEFFKVHCPGLGFVVSPKKKPYPDGIELIAEKLNVAPQHIAMVDDRLLTGVLAAILAGARAIYITKPMTAFRKRPIKEAFFASLRYLERIIFK